MTDGEALISVQSLSKRFSTGLFKKRIVEAVRAISFDVHRGEIFGFLGPNGAGKTTTIKMLTGLIRPSSGQAFLFGSPIGHAPARQRIGFMPENPYVFPYLTPREFVRMSGQLSGMSGKELDRRTDIVLDRVGILYAADRQVRRLSKGMLQRTGLASALVSDPEMLVLDEPMSGLDPVGRKEVRELILSEREGGRTIFFSTHILSDVEAMCDRVTILRKGEVVVSGPMRELLRGDVLSTEVLLANVEPALREALTEAGHALTPKGELVVVSVAGGARVEDVLKLALEAGAAVVEVVPRKETLEDVFMKKAL